MNKTHSIAAILFAFGMAGCATQGGGQGEELKFYVSDRADEIIEEQGKASAVMLGHVTGTESDLICERFYKKGSHIKINACYTRGERERYREKLRKELQHIKDGGVRATEGAGGGGDAIRGGGQ